MAFVDETAARLLSLMTSREASAREVTAAFCDRIETVEPSIQALLHYDRALAMSQADAVDAKRAKGEPLGSLAGVPVVVKDVLCAKGTPTTCGSRMLRNYIPPYDAHVVAQLRKADAVLIARANMDEFAMGSSTENSAFHPTANPWNLAHTPGGSSGGSAAAIAAKQAPLALGTDTGGSVRQPASFCGVVGLKPTYGRVSRYGLVAYGSSLDQVGPMAWTVEDAALLLQTIAGHDPRDATCAAEPVPDYAAALSKPLAGLRLGVVPEHFGPGLDAEVAAAVQAAVKNLESLGATVVEVDLPHAKYCIATYYLVATAEA
ncbi:MAG: amidase, partial [Planctomycetia bacterium]